MNNLLKANMIFDANFCRNSLKFCRSEFFFLCEKMYRKYGKLFYANTLF